MVAMDSFFAVLNFILNAENLVVWCYQSYDNGGGWRSQSYDEGVELKYFVNSIR